MHFLLASSTCLSQSVHLGRQFELACFSSHCNTSMLLDQSTCSLSYLSGWPCPWLAVLHVGRQYFSLEANLQRIKCLDFISGSLSCNNCCIVLVMTIYQREIFCNPYLQQVYLPSTKPWDLFQWTILTWYLPCLMLATLVLRWNFRWNWVH